MYMYIVPVSVGRDKVPSYMHVWTSHDCKEWRLYTHVHDILEGVPASRALL